MAAIRKDGGHVGDRGKGTFTINLFLRDVSVAILADDGHVGDRWKGTFTINLFLCDVSVAILADGGHVGDRGKGTFTINVFLCDVSVAAGGHVDLYRPYPTRVNEMTLVAKIIQRR